MATFGITAQGASRNQIGTDQLHLCGTFSPATTGTLRSFTAWLDGLNAPSQGCKFALYTNKAGPYPDTLVTGSDTVEQQVAFSSQAQYTVLCTGSPTVTGGTAYWIAIATDAVSATIEIAYDAGSDLKFNTATYTSGFPATLPAGYSDIAFQYSIAANYDVPLLPNVVVVDSAVALAASR